MTDEQLFEQNVHDVYFDYDKAELRPQDSTVTEQDAAFLVKHPDMKLVIEGHCDERGSAEYNIALGQRRAESLLKALVTDGVPASSIRVISYGKEKPFCTESNEQCWQQNRRDHLRLDR
jgi:peptidoglycan-associated lipoprotein